MGKCSVCGKRIEYNQFRKVDGKVYCLKCTPEKEEKKIAETLMKTVKDSKVKFDEFEKAMDEVSEALTEDKIADDPDIEIEMKEEKTPRKKRGKK